MFKNKLIEVALRVQPVEELAAAMVKHPGGQLLCEVLTIY